MGKPKMTEFEAETRAEYLAYFYIIGKLSADAMYHTDKKKNGVCKTATRNSRATERKRNGKTTFRIQH